MSSTFPIPIHIDLKFAFATVMHIQCVVFRGVDLNCRPISFNISFLPRQAVESDLRRPWDGPDGANFLQWRLITVTKDPDAVDEKMEAQLVAMRKGDFVYDSDNEDEDIGKQAIMAVGY